MKDSESIIIVGAGPVGLFTAQQLVAAGRKVVVLETLPELAADMRASTFHPATLDILAEFGLAAELIARGTRAPQWQYLIHKTRERVVFDLALIADLSSFPFRLQCEQFNLTRLIAARLREDRNFTLRLGTTVEGIDHDEQGVRVKLRSGGGVETLQTPWLIAADGGKSTCRKLLKLNFEGAVFPKTSITMVLNRRFQEDLPELLPVNYVWTEDAHYSLMQIRDLWRFTYSPDQNQSVDEALSEPVARAHLQRVFPRGENYQILQANAYTLQERCLESFRVDRVMFVGDAAHLNSPAGGMGMNSGIHDARCLVEHLLPVLAGASPELLDRYDRRRRTIARDEVQRLSARNYWRHRETDSGKRQAIWRNLQETVSDPEKMRAALLDSSMISSRQREAGIA